MSAIHSTRQKRPLGLAFSPFTRRAIAVLFAGLSQLVLLALLQWSQSNQTPEKKDWMVRQITVTLPPPPPPPAQQHTQNSHSVADLDFTFQTEGLTLKTSTQQVKVNEMRIEKPPINQLTQLNLSLDWSPDWQAFGLEQLDHRPQLLTPIRVSFPHRLYQRGVNRAQVKLLVMIDEQGQVHLQKITQLKYPELKPSLKHAISQARFTPPKVDGKLVKAEFIWPLELEHS